MLYNNSLGNRRLLQVPGSYKDMIEKAVKPDGKVAMTMSLCFLISCANAESRLSAQHEPIHKTCEQMTQDVSTAAAKSTVLNDALVMTSQSMAYSATAAGYILDYSVLAAAGVVTVGVMCPGIFFGIGGKVACLPFQLLSHIDSTNLLRSTPKAESSDSKDSGHDGLVFTDGKDIPPGFLGPKIYETTASFRENSRLIDISRAYRGAAQCYVDRGDKESLIKAYWLMKWLSDSVIQDQVSPNERREIHSQTSRVNGLLTASYPSFLKELDQKHRELAANLIRSAAILHDWQNPKDGSLWRFLQAGVQTGEIAKVACSHLDHGHDGKKKWAWRLPTRKELEKAAASGLITTNQGWNLVDKSMFVFASSDESQVKLKRYFVRGKNVQEATDDASPSNLLCTL